MQADTPNPKSETTSLDNNIQEGLSVSNNNDNELDSVEPLSEVVDEEGGDRYPKSNRLLTAIIIGFLGACVFGFDMAMTRLNESIAFPYNYVLEFYNITLLLPAQTFPKVWGFLNTLSLTSNPDINLGIRCAGMFLYSAIVLWLYALWVEFIGIIMARLGGYNRPDIGGAFKVYFLPALIALLFFLLLNVFLLYGDTSVMEY